MSVTKTQGSFPDDGSDAERRSGPSAQQAEPAVEAVTGPPAPDALTGLPERLAAAGRAAGRLIEAVAGTPAMPRPEAEAAGEAHVDGVPGEKPTTTGVIFVHGIGSQKQGETLLQWSAPIIEVLTGWKRWVVVDPELIRDPVEAARIDFSDDRPTIDLIIPAATVDKHEFPEARWILTESWWAAKVEPPALSTMTSWLGPQGGAGQIVKAVLGNRAGTHIVFRAAVAPFVSVLAGLILTIYTLVRGVTALIPIKAVTDAAILRAFDEFLTGWFGDVRILVYDPVQSANIRAGLAGAIRKLREVDHVDRVVVVAHSGGAMVSFLTLTDPVYADLEVDKLITFGEGWNLATTLTPADRGLGDRLRLDITKRRHPMLWRDYWASHDPAPAGAARLSEIDGGGANPDRVRSRLVWNRRSLLDDHGTYFENDEEFTLSVLREIDSPKSWGETPAGEPPRSRFYPTAPGNEEESAPPVDRRERRHRERVSILALWRQLAIAIPIAVITAVLASPTRLTEIGQLAVAPIKAIPVVNEVGTIVIDWLRSLEAPPVQVLQFWLPDVVSWLGLGTLQAIVLVSLIQLIFAPVTAFEAWSRDDWRRGLFIAIEGAIVVGLVVATLPLILTADHGRLLGSQWGWWPGVALTMATVAFAWVGSTIPKVWPATTRLFAAGAVIVFAAAMASAVLAIFERPDLEVGELGYAVIWIAFILLYKLGMGRWTQWDRIERRMAYRNSPDETVRRRSVWLSMIGFLLAGVAFSLWFLNSGWGLFGFPIEHLVGAAGAALIGAAVVVGSVDWRGAENAISSPGAVESARGRV
jgi:hypothetical protein